MDRKSCFQEYLQWQPSVEEPPGLPEAGYLDKEPHSLPQGTFRFPQAAYDTVSLVQRTLPVSSTITLNQSGLCGIHPQAITNFNTGKKKHFPTLFRHIGFTGHFSSYKNLQPYIDTHTPPLTLVLSFPSVILLLGREIQWLSLMGKGERWVA